MNTDLDDWLRELVLFDPTHSPVGASSAHRWFECPGSIGLIATLGDGIGTSSEPAREGTAAHDTAAHCLDRDQDAWEFVGAEVTVEGQTFTVDEDMSDGVQMYLDFCRGLEEEHGLGGLPESARAKMIFVEHKFKLSEISDSAYGTADFAVVSTSVLDVVDFKFGRGIGVDPEDNPQLLYYAAGVLMSLPKAAQRGVLRVRLHIVQPRYGHPKGPIRSWEITAADLHKWINKTLVPKLTSALAPGAIFELGEHCRFCPARVVCPKLRKVTAEAAKEETPANELSDEDLGRDLFVLRVLEFRRKAVEEEAYKRGMRGRKVPGFKIVDGKTKRVWKDGAEEAAEELFGEKAKATVFKPITAVAKMGKAGKDFVAEWAYKPRGKLTLAPESDDRPERPQQDAGAVFANVQNAD